MAQAQERSSPENPKAHTRRENDCFCRFKNEQFPELNSSEASAGIEEKEVTLRAVCGS